MIWDTQGEIEKRIFGHPYFQGTAAVCIVADATSPDAIETMVELAHICDVEAAGGPASCCAIRSTCSHLDSERGLAASFDIKRWPLFLTSAKDDINVTQAFEHTANAIVRRGL